MEFITENIGSLVTTVLEWAPTLVGAIIVWIVGLWIISRLMKVISKAMANSGLDKDLVPFLTSIISVLLKVMLVFTVAGVVGIETTSFIALLGMAGLAIGMALQGTLSHFAAGVMVMIFKPYKVGDLVDIQGVVGTIEEVQIFNTIIRNLDNKKTIMPNGIATSGIMTNLSSHEYLRVDLNVAMPYEADFDRVQGIILDAIKSTPKVMNDPAPVVEIEKFDANNILLAVRPFAKTEDYWDVYFGTYKNVKAALGKSGIRVAYPRTDVQVTNTMANAN